MGSLIGILALLFGLVVSVALHELGHMIPAKLFGVGVPDYSVGFGPVLASKRWGPTVYHLRAIPLGGFVRILGMVRPTPVGGPLEPDLVLAQEPGWSKSASMASQARAEAVDELRANPGMFPFYLLPWWKKLIVMAGGIVMNAVLAVLLTVLALSGIGIQSPTTSVSQVSSCASQVACGAQQAGVRPGDRIVAVDGTPTGSWSDVTALISGAEAASVSLTVQRDGDRLKMSVPLHQVEGRALAGISPVFEHRRLSAGESLGAVWQQFTGTASLVAKLPVAVWTRAQQIVGLNSDAKDVPLSVVGVFQMGSAIGSSGSVGLWDKAAAVLSVLGSLNMALFVFNLIPLLPLDGGHVVGSIFEGVRGAYRRVRGLPDVGAVDVARLLPLSYAVIGLLAVMTVILVVADFVSPLV